MLTFKLREFMIIHLDFILILKNFKLKTEKNIYTASIFLLILLWVL